MSIRAKVGYGFLAIVVLVCTLVVLNIGKNDDQNWQVIQYPGGTMEFRDSPGWYFKWAASVWTWPRAMTVYRTSDSRDGDSPNDDSFRVTFNDGGTAKISTMIRFQTPVLEKDRQKAHRDFSGNQQNMVDAIFAHLQYCAKATAPLMSSSENQSARKAEFAQLIGEQLTRGLYKMRKISKTLKDKTDTTGKAITVFATEIILDTDGTPLIAVKSPLEEYGIKVLQFSVTATEYDSVTLAQFEAKKRSFLSAEKYKAERGEEVQKRLQIIERGLREKAEVEAKANKEMAAATIEADKQKQVAETEALKKLAVEKLAKEEAEVKAEKEKRLAEIAAEKLVKVAEFQKIEAETQATMKLEVARLDAQAAVEQAKAVRELAAAEEDRIKKAGAMTEREKITLEIDREKAIGVAGQWAQGISKWTLPRMMINGATNGKGGSTDIVSTMLPIWMMNQIDRQQMSLAPVIVPRSRAFSTPVAAPLQQKTPTPVIAAPK